MKKLIKITGMSAFLTLFKMLIGFVISKAAAIYAGPTGVVMLGQMQNMIGSVMGIFNAPVGTGVIKYTAEHGENKSFWWWRASLIILLFISIPVIAVMVMYSGVIAYYVLGNRNYGWLIILVSFTFPIAAAGTLITSIFNGLELYRKYLISGALSTLISFIVMVYLIIKYQLEGVLIAAGIQGGITGAVLLFVAFKTKWYFWSNFFGKVNKKHLLNICKFFMMTAVSAMLFPATILIVRSTLAKVVGFQDAGNWQAVWRVSEAYLAIITMALGTYYLPKLSKTNGLTNIITEIHSVLKLVLPIVIFMAFFVYLVRDFLIVLLFTKEFSLARNLFGIQLIGDVVKIISWLYAYPILAHGKAKIYIITEMFFSLLFILLTYCLVIKIGVHGANYAYLINYSIYFLVMRYLLKKVIN